MSWFSDMLEKRKRFYERYPGGDGADWLKFLSEEAVKAETPEQEKRFIDDAAKAIVESTPRF